MKGSLVLCAACALLAGAIGEADLPVPLYTAEAEAKPIEGVLGVIESQRIQPTDLPTLHRRLQRMIDARDSVLPVAIPLAGSTAIVELRSAARGTDDRVLASGRVTSAGGGQLALVVTPATLDGRLRVGDTHYLLRSSGSAHFLLTLDPGALPPEAPPYLPKALSTDTEHDHVETACDHDVGKVIRALVLYTRAARDGALASALAIHEQSGASGPPPDDPDQSIETAVQLALKQANTALKNSGAKTRFSTTIKAGLVDDGYVEPGSGGPVLAALYNSSHPLRQTVAALRTAQQANLVALVIEHWEYCGGAPVMIDWNLHPDQAAFSVVLRACIGIEEASLGHELAHSMGSAHDRANAVVPGLFRYSYGHNQPAAKAGTMMAYACEGCTREAHFSNPAVPFPSGGYGTHASGCPVDSTDADCPPAHNVESLDRASCQVAQWQ